MSLKNTLPSQMHTELEVKNKLFCDNYKNKNQYLHIQTQLYMVPSFSFKSHSQILLWVGICVCKSLKLKSVGVLFVLGVGGIIN